MQCNVIYLMLEKSYILLKYIQSFTKYFRLILVLCEIAHYGKSLISVFQRFFATINKIFILAGRLSTRLSFYEVFRLADIVQFSKILSLKSFGNLLGNSYIRCL